MWGGCKALRTKLGRGWLSMRPRQPGRSRSMQPPGMRMSSFRAATNGSGHGGVALAVMAPSLLERMPPLPGWMGAPDPFDFDATQVLLADDARRYTQSTMSYVSIAALTASLDQLLSLGEAQIETHARGLSAMLIERARKNGWQPFREPSDRAASPHIVSLMRPDQQLESTLEALRTANVVCSSRGGRVRVSLAPYNDEGDIDSLVAALG